MGRTLRALVVVAAVVSVAGCGFEQVGAQVGECVGAAIGRPLGEGLGSSMQEAFGPFGDWAVRGAPDSGVTLTVSARHSGGRLWVAFEGPVADGTLPRSPVPGDCTRLDTISWRDDADGQLYPVAGAVSVDGGAEPGAAEIDLALTQLRRTLRDGGTEPLPDRRLVLPVR